MYPSQERCIDGVSYIFKKKPTGYHVDSRVLNERICVYLTGHSASMREPSRSCMTMGFVASTGREVIGHENRYFIAQRYQQSRTL